MLKMPRLNTLWMAALANVSLLLPAVSEGQFQYEPLSAVRTDIVFPDLSPEERRIVAEQAQLLLRNLYVNRINKQDFYEDLEDPVRAITRVVDNIDTLTTAEMESRTSSLTGRDRCRRKRGRHPFGHRSCCARATRRRRRRGSGRTPTRLLGRCARTLAAG